MSKVNADIVLYVLAYVNKVGLRREYFFSLEMAIERFNYLKVIKYQTLIEKMEIKAIYGFIKGVDVVRLEEKDAETLKRLEESVDELYPKGKLIMLYPRPIRLRDVLPNITATQLHKATGMTFKACEKLIFEPIKFDMFAFDKLNRICEAYNLSIYIFFK